MKLGSVMLVCAALLAIGFGVLFSSIYPQVDINGGIVALFVLAALATCLLIAAGWNALRRAGTTAAGPTPPAGADSPASRPGDREH